MKEFFPGVALDPAIQFGKPVIKGTRVPVELVIGKIAGGMTIETVMKEYELTHNDVLAALRYAAHVLQTESVFVTA